MNLNFKISLLLLMFCGLYYAQEVSKDKDGNIMITTHCMKRPIKDTLAYLKKFEVDKANYIGQPFSKLLNNISPIQPKTVWTETDGRKKTITIGSRFKFCLKELSFYNAVTLLIYWQDPISSTETRYYEQKNAFYFTNEEKGFYGNKIIKDIKVYR